MAKMITQLLKIVLLNHLIFFVAKKVTKLESTCNPNHFSIFTGESSGYMGILTGGIFVQGQKCPKYMTNLFFPRKPCP